MGNLKEIHDKLELAKRLLADASALAVFDDLPVLDDILKAQANVITAIEKVKE